MIGTRDTSTKRYKAGPIKRQRTNNTNYKYTCYPKEIQDN